MAIEHLTDEERRALRGSKFAPLPSQPASSRSRPRLSHPGGPLKTNKAAALAKFLERKLNQDPHALSSINPEILELAVQNAKASVLSSSGTNIRHVDSFDEPEGSSDEGEPMNSEPKKQKSKKKKKKKKKKNKRKKTVEDSECGVGKRPKKKLNL